MFVAILGILYFYSPKIIEFELFKSKKIKKMRDTLTKLGTSLKDLSDFENILVPIFVISLIVQLFRCVLFICIYQSIGAQVNFVYYLLFIPIVFVLMLIPLSVGGLGVRESALIFLFSFAGVPSETSLSAGFIFHVLQLMALIPGLIFFGLKSK
jgi:uncharacterized protein (TIRG00374 family)